MRDYYEDYVAEQADLLAFFGTSPRALFNTPPKTTHWEPALVDATNEYQTRLGGRPLFMGDEAVVITGQQPGLLTGPLYTIYKAATAIRLARKIHDRFGMRCVPVFWVASDDHDFEEVRTAHLFTKGHEILSLKYTPSENVDLLPMYGVPLEDSLHGLIDQAAAETTGSEFRDEVAAFLHESLDASDSLADWAARLMVRLFLNTPLVVFAPHLPAARQLAASVIEQEIRDPVVSTMLLNDVGRRLKEIDLHQQIVKGDSECNFFLEIQGRRRKVIFENERYQVPDEDMSYSIDDLAALLQQAPERFSPNVALRCIVQQHLFPVAAYVAGPGEIAYWAQLKPLFRHFGKEMPAVYPRARALLTDLKFQQLMDKFQFSIDDLWGPPEPLVERALQRAAQGPARDIVLRHRAGIERALQPLAPELEPVNKPAAAMARRIETSVKADLDKLETVILKSEEAQTDAVRKQVARLTALVYPFRKPQERVLNLFSFLFEYGWDLVPRLVKELDIDTFGVQEIQL